MLIKRLMLATAVLIGLAGSAAAADTSTLPEQEQLGVLLQTIRANRRALVEVNLQLSAEEAAKFWPLYDRYQQELNAIGDRIAAVVKEYIDNFATVSNEKALELIGNYLTAEADRLQVRRTYLPEFAKVVPGRTVARFYQIENKMDAVLRYDLASTIPVVEEKPAAPK